MRQSADCRQRNIQADLSVCALHRLRKCLSIQHKVWTFSSVQERLCLTPFLWEQLGRVACACKEKAKEVSCDQRDAKIGLKQNGINACPCFPANSPPFSICCCCCYCFGMMSYDIDTPLASVAQLFWFCPLPAPGAPSAPFTCRAV